ncbi:unnamed protein product [Merluccius merluccius]
MAVNRDRGQSIDERCPRLAGEAQELPGRVTARSSGCKREARLRGQMGARGHCHRSEPPGFISEYEG